jgi:hypothetical protein
MSTAMPDGTALIAAAFASPGGAAVTEVLRAARLPGSPFSIMTLSVHLRTRSYMVLRIDETQSDHMNCRGILIDRTQRSADVLGQANDRRLVPSKQAIRLDVEHEAGWRALYPPRGVLKARDAVVTAVDLNDRKLRGVEAQIPISPLVEAVTAMSNSTARSAAFVSPSRTKY